MQVPLVMTIIGKDRTGLVESVARLVADHGGNWQESRMCRMCGEFAGILHIQVPAEQERALAQALQELQNQGLTVVIRTGDTGPDSSRKRMARLELVCHDRAGIISQISGTLARHGINVEELATECSSAPMSGEMLFKALAKLQLPESCSTAEIRSSLERVVPDIMVDLSLAELPEKT
jgi:glycine cleavage system regulatory protein